jgi:hypothetical protein
MSGRHHENECENDDEVKRRLAHLVDAHPHAFVEVNWTLTTQPFVMWWDTN